MKEIIFFLKENKLTNVFEDCVFLLIKLRNLKTLNNFELTQSTIIKIKKLNQLKVRA